MNLSLHFTLEEMVFSELAVRQGISNVPTEAIIDNLRHLCATLLEPTRAALGPLRITSGYRSKSVNDLVGGSRNSQHVAGEAADFQPLQRSLDDAVSWCRENLPFDQIIREYPPGGWVHISVSTSPRSQVLLAEVGKDGNVHYRAI